MTHVTDTDLRQNLGLESIHLLPASERLSSEPGDHVFGAAFRLLDRIEHRLDGSPTDYKGDPLQQAHPIHLKEWQAQGVGQLKRRIAQHREG